MLRSGLDASPLEGSSTHFCCARCGLIPFSEVWARPPRLGTPSPGCVAAAGGGCGSGEAPGSSPSAGARRRRADSRAQSAPETLAAGRGGIGGASGASLAAAEPRPRREARRARACRGREGRRAGGLAEQRQGGCGCPSLISYLLLGMQLASQPSCSLCYCAVIQALWSCARQRKALLEVFVSPGVLCCCVPTAYGKALLHVRNFKAVDNPVPFRRQKNQPLTEVSILRLFACRISWTIEITLISLPVFVIEHIFKFNYCNTPSKRA